MNCYECGTTEGLSIKGRTSAGNLRMLCKSCRRDQYYQTRSNDGTKSEKLLDYTSPESHEWRKRAEESYRRILEAHYGC